MTHEKPPMGSKKFLAWLISELTWKGIVLVILLRWLDDPTKMPAGVWWILLTIVVTAGFISVGFILGQAALDKYVRVAALSLNPDRQAADDPTDPKVPS